MRSFFAWAMALALLCAAGQDAAAQDQVTVAMQNSDAVARKLFSDLVARQIGAPVAADKFWAYEVDFNLDGFSEIYGFVDEAGCDGVKCGLFLFVLQGDGYRELLGELAGARLTDPAKVSLGNFKRSGFIDLQLDGRIVSWDGQRYVDAGTFPATQLDAAVYLDACAKANPDDAVPADAVSGSPCQCRFERFQAIGFTQDQLDHVVEGDYSDGDDPNAYSRMYATISDVVIGCEISMGRAQWQPAYFTHGDKEQTQVLTFDAFIDTCKGQEWVVDQRKIGSPDRAEGLCGCLARELPTYGVTQGQLDLVTGYYAGVASENDLDADAPDLLDSHDAASEACLQQFPSK